MSDTIPRRLARDSTGRHGLRGVARGAVAVGLGVWILASAAAGGASAEEVKFMGTRVESMSGTYEVVTDANVRAGPETASRRVGGLRQGTQVEAVGKAQGAWIAVRRAGRDLGFVYEPLLKAVSLPPLERNAKGQIVDADGKPLVPASGFYIAASDVNLRDKPSTRAKKRGQLERGTRVEAIGSAEKGSWLAVRRGGQEQGFVFAEILMPMIDGTLKDPVTGTSSFAPNNRCQYSIRFTGKNPVQGEIFDTSDYQIDWKCTVNGKDLAFPGFMFITEAPFQLNDSQVYQINIDLLRVVRAYDEVFSTIFLYRRTEKKVAFDSVSMSEFGSAPPVKVMAAESVTEALSGAAKMAPTVWNGDVWKMLGEQNP